tara:strand:+ start:828 stop:1961 length:1134 start_codon:yes stop_codon:yes gene_type:complete
LKTVSLLHPFSAKAIGLEECDLYKSHSKPHELALIALQKEGYAVTIDYFTGKWFPYKKQINSITKRFWPITYPIFTKRHRWRKQKSSLHHSYIKKNAPDLTIINMSGHGSPYVFNHAALLKKMHRPYIAMIGGIHMTLTGKALKYYQNAEHLIVHTHLQKKELQKNNYFKELDIRVMPLGIDIDKFKPLQNKSNDSFNLLFVGRISRLKQIELAIKAVANLVNENIINASLTIIGPKSDENYYKELKALVGDLKIDNHVFFKGVISHDNLISYYQNADVFVMPSAHESFGMVMVEAMACGTPVIALEGAGGPDEIIDNGETGYLCLKDNFSEKVYQLINNKPLLNDFANNSRHVVKQKWSIQQTLNSFKNSVESIID